MLILVKIFSAYSVKGIRRTAILSALDLEEDMEIIDIAAAKTPKKRIARVETVILNESDIVLYTSIII
jgi:hypothetical protein